jgi:hypothetical protein
VDPETGALVPAPGQPGDPATPNDPATPGPAEPGDPQMLQEDVVAAIAGAEALPMTLIGEPIYSRAVRLTHSQWERSLRQLLQLDAPTGHQVGLTQDAVGEADFSNNERLLEIETTTLWNDYRTAAVDLAALVAGSEASLGRIYSGTDAAGFITTLGRRAYRRPLTTAEVQDYQAIFNTGAALSEGGSTEFARGAGLVIEAMLQSPHFLYRTELVDGGSRLDGFEMAAKLSLTLRGTAPDDALLDAAFAGELDTDAGVMTVASRLVDDASAIEVMREYHGELFHFNRYLTIEKDTRSVPEYSTDMNPDLQEAAYLYFDRIYSTGGGLREMLTSTVGYVSPTLAPLYGVPAPASGFQELDLGAQRPGYFTQLPFLILTSINLVPDSIHRGVALNLELLCAEIPPPAAVGTVTLPPIQDDQSNRQRVEAGTGDGTCGAGCHSVYINTLGFAFENYDGLGRYRETDAGNPVDASSQYPFNEGTLSFNGPAELMDKMLAGEQAHLCYAKHLASFALQRDLSDADRPLLDSIAATSATSSIKQMLLTLVVNPAFTTRGAQ